MTILIIWLHWFSSYCSLNAGKKSLLLTTLRIEMPMFGLSKMDTGSQLLWLLDWIELLLSLSGHPTVCNWYPVNNSGSILFGHSHLSLNLIDNDWTAIYILCHLLCSRLNHYFFVMLHCYLLNFKGRAALPV